MLLFYGPADTYVCPSCRRRQYTPPALLRRDLIYDEHDYISCPSCNEAVSYRYILREREGFFSLITRGLLFGIFVGGIFHAALWYAFSFDVMTLGYLIPGLLTPNFYVVFGILGIVASFWFEKRFFSDLPEKT